MFIFLTYQWIITIGNVLNGTIGKQMVDTLVESTANVEVNTLLFYNCIRILFIKFINKSKFWIFYDWIKVFFKEEKLRHYD